jgi:hypothetical protein
MKNLLTIIFISLLIGKSAFAEYGGWIDMIVNSKEHNLCGDYARSQTSDKNKQVDYYYQCRNELEITREKSKY